MTSDFQGKERWGTICFLSISKSPILKHIIFQDRKSLWENFPDLEILPTLLSGYPLILKANSGGEGAFVFLIHSQQELIEKLELIPKGPIPSEGFILQERIDHGGKDLRVVVLFDTLYAYWRIQPNPDIFLTNQSQGGRIEFDGDVILKDRAVQAVRGFCESSGINLAALDIIFDRRDKSSIPLFLEINYYFGRRGLGGSMRFYEMFEQAADRWLASVL